MLSAAAPMRSKCHDTARGDVTKKLIMIIKRHKNKTINKATNRSQKYFKL